MKFIAISGNAGTGKDYITRYLLVPMITNGLSYSIASFADHFKIESIVKEGLDRQKVYGRKDKHTRHSLQQKGTEQGRHIFGEDIWINILNERLKQYEERGIEYVFITDCRFQNEIQYVKNHGGLILRIHAPDRHAHAMKIEGTTTSHISEKDCENYNEWDYVIDNTFQNVNNIADEVRNIALSIREKWKYPHTIFCDLDDTLVECSRNYSETANEVRRFCIENNISTELFDAKYSEYNQKCFDLPFTRDRHARMLTSMFEEQHFETIYNIAMRVHTKSFPLLSSKAYDFITECNKKKHLVIVTLGDPVDQIRKLYKIGFVNVKIECVVHKNVYTYRALMHKYPSEKYTMIGDSLKSDILPAREAGIQDVYHVTKETPIEDYTE